MDEHAQASEAGTTIAVVGAVLGGMLLAVGIFDDQYSATTNLRLIAVGGWLCGMSVFWLLARSAVYQGSLAALRAHDRDRG